MSIFIIYLGGMLNQVLRIFLKMYKINLSKRMLDYRYENLYMGILPPLFFFFLREEGDSVM